MNALVVGGGACLWDDLLALGPWDGLVVGVNDAGAYVPRHVHHFATLHPEKLPDWRAVRAELGGNLDFTTWTRPEKQGQADRVLSGWSSGSSGFLAVGVAFEVGAERVVLAGVPMQADAAHFFDRQPWDAVRHHLQAWERRADVLRGRVFSMSGWTRELLGPPPWLQQEVA